ncbi:MAG: tRNA pseudouridine(38-40) synthase TruA [Chloroflexota bacterium]
MESEGGSARTIRLDLAYEGTRYHGFGLQPSRRTIQEVLEEALARSLGERVRVTAAGRTDAGVHASGQVIGFATRGHLAPETLVRAANAHLPDDVLVTAAAEMPPAWDARRSALRRHYRYHIWSHRLPSLWWRRWSWHLTDRPDLDAMNVASAQLLGTHDFASFLGHRSQEPAGRTTVRTVERAQWWQEGDLLGFEIVANAFLRHMVRGIVGTLVEVGRGRLDPAHFGQILETRDRREAGPNAPPHGLILTGVDYPTAFERTRHKTEHEDRAKLVYPGPDGCLGDRTGGRSSVSRDAIGGRRATGVS